MTGAKASLTAWYVLVDPAVDLYHDMAAVSVACLRRVEPTLRIGLLTDQATAQAMQRKPKPLSGLVDEVRVGHCPEMPVVERSRYLKIRLRAETAGPIVYLDADTIAVRPIQDLADEPGEVLMAYDCPSGSRKPRGVPAQFKDLYADLRWTVPAFRYFNSGVSVWRDSDAARALAEAWLEAWRASVTAGTPNDQPALNHVDSLLGGVIRPMPMRYNAQVDAWEGFARGARIWHFWYSQVADRAGPRTLLVHLLDVYRRTGRLDEPALRAAIDDSYPWVESRGMLSYLRTGNPIRALAELSATARRWMRRRQEPRPT